MMRPRSAPSSPVAPPACQATAGVTIGAAHLRELPGIARLQRRAFPPRLAYTLGTLALLWALPWVRLLVARRDRAIVGCIIGDRVIEGARVINLAVDPDCRRQGIGAALLRALDRALPGGDLVLMVQIENLGAQALYRSEGFAVITEAPNYYGSGRSGLWMRRSRETGGVSRQSSVVRRRQ
jgi:ribosomal-protein-alanine N-acetyltransferase